MAESSLFLAGKLRKPENLKTSADEDVKSQSDIKSKKPPAEVEKPWVGTAALRELGKRNEARNKETQVLPKVPSVGNLPSVPLVGEAPEVGKVPKVDNQSPLTPTRDFHRVPNSINRVALEGGMFTRPSCKHVYDALYLLTRGAIQPSRKVQIGRKSLQKKAGIGSDKTLDAAVSSLQNVGLIKVDIAFGSQKGNIYEVFLPEEINREINTLIKLKQGDFNKATLNTVGTDSTHSTNGTESTNSTFGYKAPNVPLVENTYGTISQTTDRKEAYDVTNTSLKTNTKSDDEAFAALNEVFAQACKEVSGKLPNKNQQEKWKQLAELLVMELKVASARTTSVSDVPAFLTEHLRRRLTPAKREVANKEASKPKPGKSTQTGKQQPAEPIETYQAEPLTEQGRESTKQAFAGYLEKGQKEFLLGLQDSYTKEDWEWLMKELKIS